jgi:hypothetical protein
MLKSSVQSKKTIITQNMPHKSRITKIERRHHSLEQAKSDINSFKINSIIHTTIRRHNEDDFQTNKSFVSSRKDLQSIYQEQNTLKSTNLIRSDLKKVQKVPSYLSNTQVRQNISH